MTDSLVRIDRLDSAVFRFPTGGPETDATLTWTSTVAVVATVHAAGEQGIGWTYSSPAAAAVIEHELAPRLLGHCPFDIAEARIAMYQGCRDIGTKGLVAHAISAVDIALWDLKARLHGVPLSTLFGGSRASVPVYGSGGFTNLDDAAFDAQIETWASAGCRAMKIKIGRDRGGDLSWDLARAQRLCAAAPADTALMVDANGAYTVGQACRVGAALDQLGYSWFEEPVTSDDTEGLAAVSHSVRCDVAAGEYANDGYDVAALLDAVDCLQLDVTRCGGYSGFLRWAAMAATRGVEVSGHSAPSLHAPVAAAVPNLRHLEWFVDHARVEPLLVDGTPQVQDGMLPTSGAGEPGHGMTLTKTSPSRA